MEKPHLSRADFLLLAGHTQQYWDFLVQKEHVSLAFGSQISALHNHYLVLDGFAMRTAAELSQLILRQEAAQIVLSHWGTWMGGLARAEWDRRPIFFVVGVLPVGKKRDFLVCAGTNEEINADFLRNKFQGAKYLALDLKRLIAAIRETADDAAIEIPNPLLPRPDSPEYAALIQQGEQHRKKAMERMRERARKRAGREHRVQ